MLEESLFPHPLFIPKFSANENQYAQEFSGQPAFLIPAHFCGGRYRRLHGIVRNGCNICIVDPVTNAFTYDGFLRKPSYRNNLPYCPPQQWTARDFTTDPERRRSFVEQVIDFELEAGAGIVVAPYFFARDTDDLRFRANLEFLSESRRYVDNLSEQRPLFAMVNIGKAVVLSPPSIDEVVRQYRDGTDVQGYLIVVEDFDDRSAEYEALMGLSRLVLSLSEGHDAIVCSIAAFGEVLTALGANGFSSGVGWLETFRETSLRSYAGRAIAFGAQRRQYYYVSELFSYLPPEDARRVFDRDGCPSMERFRCSCPYCVADFPPRSPNNRKHFLLRRFGEMEELGRTPINERPNLIRRKLEVAVQLAQTIHDDALIQVPVRHLVRWLEILDAYSQIREGRAEGSPTQEEIEHLIHEARHEKPDNEARG